MAEVPDKQQFLRQTALFGLLYRMDRGFRARTPFDKFKKYIERGLTNPAAQLPDDKILELLYERAIDAIADRMWIRAAKKIAKSLAWRQHIKWLEDSVSRSGELIIQLDKGDRLLLPADVKRVKAAAASFKRLRGRLLEIQRFDRRLGDAAWISNWNAALRQLRVHMDRILHIKRPDLNQAQRTEVAKLVIEAVGLKAEEFTEAIERQLRRARRTMKTAAPGSTTI